MKPRVRPPGPWLRRRGAGGPLIPPTAAHATAPASTPTPRGTTPLPASLAVRSTFYDKGPVGWDVYRRLDRLAAARRPAARTRQFSSFRPGRLQRRRLQSAPTRACVSPAAVSSPRTADPAEVAVDLVHPRRRQPQRHRLDPDRARRRPRWSTPASSASSTVDSAHPFVWPLVTNANQTSGGVTVKVPMPYRRLHADHHPVQPALPPRHLPEVRRCRRGSPRSTPQTPPSTWWTGCAPPACATRSPPSPARPRSAVPTPSPPTARSSSPA